jgi:hypothetical protein
MKEDVIGVGDGLVTLHRKNRSEAIVSVLLGESTDAAGTRTLWLDRLVHAPKETELGEWICSGAITTVLTYCVRAVEA